MTLITQKTRGIVLQQIKYSDSQIIAHIYTEHFGRQAFMFRKAKSKKSGNSLNMLQPLFLLEIEAQIKDKRQIQRAREFRNYPHFNELPFNIFKSTIAIFLAEILARVLKEEEANFELFNFLHHAILLLDTEQEHFVNFHLLFLYELSKYLGFYPEHEFSQRGTYFNIAEGAYTEHQNLKFVLNKKESLLLSQLSGKGFHQLHEIKLSRIQRHDLLDILIQYYNYHLPEMGKVKSLDVLKQIFSG
ncbi:MAG: DNA repair protein RecO [Bacteroidales bacterium]|nr:DNA repair protein RecO [Bacteroidales bacterium]